MIGNAVLFDQNGNKLMDISNIETFEGSEETENEPKFKMSDIENREFSFGLKLSKKARKRLFNFFIFGWYAKGPLRLRAMHKALKTAKERMN